VFLKSFYCKSTIFLFFLFIFLFLILIFINNQNIIKSIGIPSKQEIYERRHLRIRGKKKNMKTNHYKKNISNCPEVQNAVEKRSQLLQCPLLVLKTKIIFSPSNTPQNEQRHHLPNSRLHVYNLIINFTSLNN
jgi:hypothetical protein